jgi:hypothetical protein
MSHVAEIATSHTTAHAAKIAAKITSRDQRTLDRIYQHPITHNLEFRDVTALFDSIGAAAPQHNGDIRLRVGDQTLTLKSPHPKDIGVDEVILIRHLLDQTSWSPKAAVGAVQTARPADSIIIIDYRGANIHRLNPDDTPYYLPHNTNVKICNDIWSADRRFFARIADAVNDAGRIVVISNGKGCNNAADHLIAWMDTHRSQVRANIVREIVANPPNMTGATLLALATHALAQPVSDATLKGAS